MSERANVPFREKLWNIFATYGVSLLWVLLFLTALAVAYRAPAALSLTERLLSQLAPQMAQPTAFVALVLAPITEEAFFRLLPLFLARNASRRTILFIQVCICGVVFGLMHGSVLNIFIQGFIGFMLGILCMKNRPSWLAAYLSCVFVHAAYNFTLRISSSAQ